MARRGHAVPAWPPRENAYASSYTLEHHCNSCNIQAAAMATCLCLPENITQDPRAINTNTRVHAQEITLKAPPCSNLQGKEHFVPKRYNLCLLRKKKINKNHDSLHYYNATHHGTVTQLYPCTIIVGLLPLQSSEVNYSFFMPSSLYTLFPMFSHGANVKP